jgi:hypothetical protein
MKLENEFWFDEDAGPLVRPYAVARGRTRPTRHNLEMTTLVVAARTDRDVNVEREYAHILRMCQQPLSIAEVSAMLNLPLAVVKESYAKPRLLLARGLVRNHLFRKLATRRMR